MVLDALADYIARVEEVDRPLVKRLADGIADAFEAQEQRLEDRIK